MSWVQAFPGKGFAYLNSDVRTKYTASLYWAITTMTTARGAHRLIQRTL